MTTINAIRITEFTFPVENIGLETAAAGVGNMAMVPGHTFEATRFAVCIETAAGISGEYVANWVSTPSTIAQAGMLAPLLLGRNPEHRAWIYDELRREIRAFDHMGHGVLDIALWDLCGKLHGMSVKSMLGGFRDSLPTYASTYPGQELRDGGLYSPEVFADYAEQCKAAGFHGLKVHGWRNGDVTREIKNLRGIRTRVGEDWNIMIDPACTLQNWNDALKLGRVCDEVNCLWYEDPYKDAAVSAYGHMRLREKLKTPLLVSEHVRGLEQKASFMLAGGCDIIHADPEYDMGITGCMKIAHFCEALGLDVQIHAIGPAQRLCMSAIRNTMLYEMALIGPGMSNMVGPVYTCGYSDQQEDLPADGFVPVPDGPGLGVTYDWDYIRAHKVNEAVFSA